MNLQTMIVLVIVIALVGLALRSIIRSRKKGRQAAAAVQGGCLRVQADAVRRGLRKNRKSNAKK